MQPARDLIAVRAKDPLRPAEVIEMISQVAGDHSVRAGMKVYVDGRDVLGVGAMSVEASLVVLRLLKANHIDSVAVYVERDDVERALLETAVQAEAFGVHLRVFRDPESAWAWLDQPERAGR